MNIRSFVYCAIAMLALPSIAPAQGGWEIDESRLPPGKTKQQVLAMLEEIDRKTAQETQQELAAMQRQDERFRRALKKYEDRVAKAIAAEPALQALQDKLRAGFKAMSNPQLSDEEREARIARMAPDMQELRQKALAKAGIDERAMNEDIIREVNSGVATRSVDQGESGGEMLEEKDGAFYFVIPGAQKTAPMSEVMTRGTSAETLGDPWPWQHSSVAVNCGFCKIDKAKGTYQVSARGEAGQYGQNYRGLAQYRTVTSGDKSYRISARMPETYWRNHATAGLFGGSRAKTWSKIEVWDGSNKRLCRAIEVHYDLVASWGRDLVREGEDTTALSCEFAAPPVNHDVVIRFISGAYVNAAAVTGYAFGRVDAQPRDVTIWVTR